MRSTPEGERWPSTLGMTSLVLGHVSLIVFFLPVIGVPVAACGLVFGAAGALLTGFRGGVGLRWALAGVAVCCLALSAGVLLHRAPDGFDYDEPPRWNPPAKKVFVPPPARPDF